MKNLDELFEQVLREAAVDHNGSRPPIKRNVNNLRYSENTLLKAAKKLIKLGFEQNPDFKPSPGEEYENSVDLLWNSQVCSNIRDYMFDPEYGPDDEFNVVERDDNCLMLSKALFWEILEEGFMASKEEMQSALGL